MRWQKTLNFDCRIPVFGKLYNLQYADSFLIYTFWHESKKDLELDCF